MTVVFQTSEKKNCSQSEILNPEKLLNHLYTYHFLQVGKQNYISKFRSNYYIILYDSKEIAPNKRIITWNYYYTIKYTSKIPVIFGRQLVIANIM